MAEKIKRPQFRQQICIKQRHPDLRAVERPIVPRGLEAILFIQIVQDFRDEGGRGILSLKLLNNLKQRNHCLPRIDIKGRATLRHFLCLDFDIARGCFEFGQVNTGKP